METVAAGMMAPESSVRTPRSVPVVCWAGALNTVSAAAKSKKPIIRKLNMLPY